MPAEPEKISGAACFVGKRPRQTENFALPCVNFAFGERAKE
jgi:hypothetical protein